MKKTILPLLLASLFLTSCGETSQGFQKTNIRWEQLMKNTLYAEQYWDDLTNRMVDLQMAGEKDPVKSTLIDEVRKMALQNSKAEGKKRREGKIGAFVPGQENAQGHALLHANLLDLSTDFSTSPGPSLKIYLSTVVDPREGSFPDDTAIELDRLVSPYGSQQYTLPDDTDTAELRTVVLYDNRLNRIYGFAQLQ